MQGSIPEDIKVFDYEGIPAEVLVHKIVLGNGFRLFLVGDGKRFRFCVLKVVVNFGLGLEVGLGGGFSFCSSRCIF